ncbi:MAG: hypothetical protein WCP79_00460 [Bacillota bacterium]
MAVTPKSSNETEKLTGGWRKLMTPGTKIRANHRMIKFKNNHSAGSKTGQAFGTGNDGQGIVIAK